MTIEAGLAAVTASSTAMLAAVSVQQTTLTNAIAGFAATTTRVGQLNLVNNTTDAAKPVSTAAQTALDAKQATLVSGINIARINNIDLTAGGNIEIQRSATSLSLVEYENLDTLRAMSPQVDDAVLVEGLGLFMWTNTQLEPQDPDTAINTATGQWLLQLPAWDLLDAWAMDEQEITENWREDEPERFAAYLLANK